jgi:hypothetical protein
LFEVRKKTQKVHFFVVVVVVVVSITSFGDADMIKPKYSFYNIGLELIYKYQV